MNNNDEYLMSQVGPLLQPGEQILFTATMRRQPGLLMQLLLVGGLLLFLMTKIYFVALTNRRMILIRSKMGFFSLSGAPKHMNLGVEEWDARQIQKVTCSGFANNRSMTFQLGDRPKQTLRISPWFKTITGTKDFFEQVPNLVNSGQLAQMASGPQMAQMPQQAGYGAPPQQAGYGAPPQQAGYGAPPQQAGYGAPPPQQAGGYGAAAGGAQVFVMAQDGNRYPATLLQEQGGHCLCAMPNGQQQWFPAQQISRG